jgi:3-oxoacyl-[acyl-carrier protein] reductase
VTRKILVTGSSGSLGAQLVETFLADGYAVVGFDIAPPASESGATSPDTAALGGAWRFVKCDVSDAASIEQALAQVPDVCPFDIVVNNAGLIYNSPLLSFEAGKLRMHDFDAWNKVLAATLSSAFFVTAHCARQMVTAARPGVIINISSICAEGNAGQAAYSAAKAGINSMTAALAKELGALGIRVAAIAPGYLDTPSTRAAMPEDALSKIRKSIPLKKLGNPRQLCHAVKFVIENEYFHGKVLELDGGLTL